MNNKYWYNAHCTEVYDGDTITVNIDLGFDMWMNNEKIRLWGIDTPELRGEEREEGLKVRDFVREKILGKDVILHTYRDKKGKYGRYLAEVYIDGENLNNLLLFHNMAEKYY